MELAQLGTCRIGYYGIMRIWVIVMVNCLGFYSRECGGLGFGMEGFQDLGEIWA